MPTANAGAPPAVIPFTDLPANVPLDGSGSSPTPDSQLWTIVSKPPGSAASLSSATSLTPTLNNVDLPGTYYLNLNTVVGADHAWDPDPASGDAENLWNIMPTAVILIQAAMQSGLVPPALGDRTTQGLSPGDVGYSDAWGKLLALYAATDQAVILPPAGGQQATRYVTAAAGPSTATGTISDPFNATSAAANGFDGPWNQAINALTTGATIAALGYNITAYAGTYDEDINITADRTWTFNWLGNVEFSSLNDLIFIGTTGTNLIMSPLADGSTCTFGRVGIGNPIAHSWYWFACGMGIASLSASGVCAAGVQGNFEHCYCAANWNLPNLTVNYADATTFGSGTSDFTSAIATRMTECTFSDDITLSSAATSGGFYDCTFTGTPLFTGPAGSARFDPITARRFIAASGTFAGGAGKADFLPITTSAIVIDNGAGTGSLTTNAITTPVSTGLTVSAGSTMSVSATTTLDLGAGGAATLTAGAGADVTITGGSSAGVVLAGGAGSTYDAKADVIAERTAAHGVIVDQVLVIDTSVKATRLFATGTDDVVVDTAGITLTLDQSVPAIIASSVIYAPNHQYLYIPLAVRPNASWDLLSAPFSDCSGTVLGVEFIAAVAATSAGGDITLALKDGSDDGDIAAATSIDGQTSVSLTVGSPGFSAGFYAQVTSDNPDAVQGAGLMALITFVVSGPSA